MPNVLSRIIAVALSAVVVVTAQAVDDHAPQKDLTAQRERFMLAWEAAKHVPDLAWRKLAVGLDDYPLYPYLELASLQHRIADVKVDEVTKFLAAHADTLPAQIMRESFLFELARRQDWKSFAALYTGNERSRDLQCDALQAKVLEWPDHRFRRGTQDRCGCRRNRCRRGATRPCNGRFRKTKSMQR